MRIHFDYDLTNLKPEYSKVEDRVARNLFRVQSDFTEAYVDLSTEFEVVKGGFQVVKEDVNNLLSGGYNYTKWKIRNTRQILPRTRGRQCANRTRLRSS